MRDGERDLRWWDEDGGFRASGFRREARKDVANRCDMSNITNGRMANERERTSGAFSRCETPRARFGCWVYMYI